MAAAAAAEWALMPRLCLVAQTPDDKDLYYLFASAPVFSFRYGGRCYQAPVLAADAENVTVKYFCEDLKDFLAGRGGLAQLVSVGAVEQDELAYFRDFFGLRDNDVWKVEGDAVAVARELTRDWVTSEYVVVAPYVAAPNTRDIESGANAAAIAAWLNAPLVYALPAGLDERTLEAVAPLGVTKAVVVEIDDVLSPAVNDALTAMGIDIVADLRTEREVVSYINELTDPRPPVLICFRGRDQAAPAAIAAARYGGFVLEVPSPFPDLTFSVQQRIVAEIPPSYRKLTEPFILPAGVREGEQAVADLFYAWLEDLGGTDETQLEYVITFSPVGPGGLAYVWDRAILGDTERPHERGAVAGRFLNNPVENLAVLALTSSYRALIFSHPRPDHVTFCGVAYMAENAVSNPTYFVDNYGVRHKVNEVLGCRGGGFNDPGVFRDFYESYYEPVLHNGREATEGEHPLVPGEKLIGFPEDVRRGTGFFYASSHGSAAGIYPLMKDIGITENAPWGSKDWPGGKRGIVDYEGPLFSFNRWDEICGNNRALVAAFNACSVGGGNMAAVVTRHLGAAALASYFPVSFQGSGWFWISFIHRLIKYNYTLGEALCYATAQVSCLFPSHREGVDPTIRYYLVGDPFMPYYHPHWEPPQPADPDANYGGHQPGGSGPLARNFAASRHGDDRVTLTWEKANSRPVKGWNLYRAVTPFAVAGGVPSPRERVNAELIRGNSPYLYRDTASAKRCHYWLEAVEENGRRSTYGPAFAEAGSPASLTLHQSYPNPARSYALIRFSLPRAASVRIGVYDLRGALVKVLAEGAFAEGEYELNWDLRDARGNPLPPGVYIYQMDAAGTRIHRRLVVVR